MNYTRRPYTQAEIDAKAAHSRHADLQAGIDALDAEDAAELAAAHTPEQRAAFARMLDAVGGDIDTLLDDLRSMGGDMTVPDSIAAAITTERGPLTVVR